MVTLEIGGCDPMLDFWVAGQSSGSAAGCVAEHQVELVLKWQLGGIQNAKMDVSWTSEKCLHRFETGRADVTGGNRGRGIALSQNGGLASRRGTTVQNFGASTSQLRDQLRSFILNAVPRTHDKDTSVLGRGRK